MVYSDIMRYGKLELKKVDSVNFISEFGFVHHKKNLQYGKETHMVFQNAVKEIVRFCLSGNRLSIGKMCCVLPTKARM